MYMDFPTVSRKVTCILDSAIDSPQSVSVSLYSVEGSMLFAGAGCSLPWNGRSPSLLGYTRSRKARFILISRRLHAGLVDLEQ